MYIKPLKIMKTYILDSINRIKRLGENLDAKTILCNKSWQIFNDTGEKELYIFQENGDILLSTNGIVSQGKWQYIYANKSILISVKENSYMLHPSFSINNIMAMNLDGTERYMLMIEEQSLLALQLKSLEDLNQYLLSIENTEKQKEQKHEEDNLQKEANREWERNKKNILNTNKEYKHYKTLSIYSLVLGICMPMILLLILIFIFIFLFDPDMEATIIIPIVLVALSLFSTFLYALYDSKCSEISKKEEKNFIERFIKENV